MALHPAADAEPFPPHHHGVAASRAPTAPRRRPTLRALTLTLSLALTLLGCAGGDPADDTTDTGQGTLPCDTPTELSGPQPLSLAGGRNFHPYGFVGDPSIVRDADGYRLWLTSSSREPDCPGAYWECLTQGIAHARSADGLVWDDRFITPENPQAAYTRLVLSPREVAWAPLGLETASVLKRPDGTWLMYFTGHQAPPEGSPVPLRDAIGVAESRDGVNWTARPQPVLEAVEAWERICLDAVCTSYAGGVLEPSVLWNPDARRYEMWYAAYGEPADSFATFRIGHAVSDDGIAWTRRPGPVLVPGAPGRWDEAVVSHVNVLRAGARYHLFYHASSLADIAACDPPNPPCSAYTPGSVGHATSEDGLNWQRGERALIDRAASADHAFFVGGPTAVLADGAIELTVFGTATAETAARFESRLFRYRLGCAG